MVIDIPMSQNLLMGQECEKACDDNFLKCTRGVKPLPILFQGSWLPILNTFSFLCLLSVSGRF